MPAKFIQIAAYLVLLTLVFAASLGLIDGVL
jgi:hypothetical protein